MAIKKKTRENDPIATVREAGKAYVAKFKGNWTELMKDMNRRTAARQKLDNSRVRPTGSAARKKKVA